MGLRNIAVLAVRKIVQEGFDIGPFRYTTLGSLRINTFKSKFMPEHMLVSNENNKNDNNVYHEWRFHCYRHIPGLEYEHEIWLENYTILQQGKTHKLCLDGYDMRYKTVLRLLARRSYNIWREFPRFQSIWD